MMFVFVILLIFSFSCFVYAISRIGGNKQDQSAASKKSNNAASPSFSVTFIPHSEGMEQNWDGTLSPFSIDAWNGYVSPSGGFVDFGRFQVTGINRNSGKQESKIIEDQDETYARRRAMANGMMEPIDVHTLPSEAPTEKQLAYARDLGISIPDGACKLDISALISRVTDNDKNPAPEDIAQEAYIAGLKFSRYHGKKAIFEMARALPPDDYDMFLSSIDSEL